LTGDFFNKLLACRVTTSPSHIKNIWSKLCGL